MNPCLFCVCESESVWNVWSLDCFRVRAWIELKQWCFSFNSSRTDDRDLVYSSTDKMNWLEWRFPTFLFSMDTLIIVCCHILYKAFFVVVWWERDTHTRKGGGVCCTLDGGTQRDWTSSSAILPVHSQNLRLTIDEPLFVCFVCVWVSVWNVGSCGVLVFGSG